MSALWGLDECDSACVCGEGGGGGGTYSLQGSKIALVHLYLRVPEAAGQVKILINLLKIIFSTYMSIIFVMQGDISSLGLPKPYEICVFDCFIIIFQSFLALSSCTVRKLQSCTYFFH